MNRTGKARSTTRWPHSARAAMPIHGHTNRTKANTPTATHQRTTRREWKREGICSDPAMRLVALVARRQIEVLRVPRKEGRGL